MHSGCSSQQNSIADKFPWPLNSIKYLKCFEAWTLNAAISESIKGIIVDFDEYKIDHVNRS